MRGLLVASSGRRGCLVALALAVGILAAGLVGAAAAAEVAAIGGVAVTLADGAEAVVADAAGAGALLRLGRVVVGVSLGDDLLASGFTQPRSTIMDDGRREEDREKAHHLAEPGNVALPEGVNLTRRHVDLAHLVLGDGATVDGAEQGGAESEDADELHGEGFGRLCLEKWEKCMCENFEVSCDDAVCLEDAGCSFLSQKGAISSPLYTSRPEYSAPNERSPL